MNASHKKTRNLDISEDKIEVNSDEEPSNLLQKFKSQANLLSLDKDFRYKVKTKTEYRSLKPSLTANNITSNKNSSMFKSDSEIVKDEFHQNINSNNFFGKETHEIKLTNSYHSSVKSNAPYKNTKQNPIPTCSDKNSKRNMKIKDYEEDNFEGSEKSESSSNLISNSQYNFNSTTRLNVRKLIFYG